MQLEIRGLQPMTKTSASLGLAPGPWGTDPRTMFTIGEIALIGASLHGMAPGVPSVGTILVSEGSLRVLAPDQTLPVDCVQVDCTGLFIVPGLIDGAAGHQVEHDILYVAAGVTTLRHTGAELARGLAEARASTRDQVPGPRVLYGGPRMASETSVPGMQWPMAAKGEDAVRQLASLLSSLAAEGAGLDGLVNDESLALSSWRALVPAAKEQGLELWGPLPNGATLEEALELGQGGIMGMDALLPPQGSWEESSNQEAIEASIQQVAKGSTAIVPMLGVLGRVLLDYPADSSELSFLSVHMVPLWTAERTRWRREVTPEFRTRLEQAQRAQGVALAGLLASGARVVPGSGTPNPWLFPGRSLVEELILWQAAGIPAERVLQAATRGAAEILLPGEPKVGTLLDGAPADLLVVVQDPTLDISALRNPAYVMVRGKLLTRVDIGARLSALRKSQADARAVLSQHLDIEPPKLPEDASILLSGEAEVYAAGLRLTQEHWIVGRLPDGARLYGSHLVHLQSAGHGGRETMLVQRITKGVLDSFDLSVKDISSGKVMSLIGRRIEDSSQMQVERRLDGAFISNTPIREQPAFLDVSPALTTMILVQHCPAGENPVLTMEGATAEPRIWPWDLTLGEDGLLRVRSGAGGVLCGVDEHGAPQVHSRVRGDRRSDFISLGVDMHGGRGTPPIKSRVSTIELEPTPPGDTSEDQPVPTEDDKL